MTDASLVLSAERLRRQQQSDHIRMVAIVLKAVVRKHYPDAVFEDMPEYETACNIENVRFGPADTGHDGDIRPPFAMLSFHIGSQDTVDSEHMEKSRNALADDLRILFGVASGNARFEPSAGSMVLQNQCTGTATVYGAPEVLHSSMRQAMEHSAELRHLLPRSHQRG